MAFAVGTGTGYQRGLTKGSRVVIIVSVSASTAKPWRVLAVAADQGARCIHPPGSPLRQSRHGRCVYAPGSYYFRWLRPSCSIGQLREGLPWGGRQR